MDADFLKKCKEHCRDLKLLYVEDNKNIRLYTTETLKHFFNNITTAEDGVDGLKKFQNEKFDLVLTDIRMPNMDGLYMAQKIREIDSSIPILVLSAHNETEYFLQCIKIGVDGFIFKPIELSHLAQSFYRATEKIYLANKLKIYQEDLEKKVEKRTKEVKYNLYHDDLTGLFNAKAMVEYIDKSKPNMLFLIDIKDFHKFNDIYGFANGNLILKIFTDKLKKFNTDQKYKLFRAYGDGFVLYYEDEGIDEKYYEDVKNSLLDYLSLIQIYLETIDEYLNLEVTVGAIFNENNSFVKSEIALKNAKNKNKNYVLYTKQIDNSKEITQNLQWQKRVKVAIDSDNIVPVFQGIVDKNQKIVKYESLMRLREYKDGKEELISPYFFLDIAKNTHQYDKLTRIMITKVFEKMKDKNIRFSINLSSKDLINPAQINFLENEIVKFDIGSKLVIEVLESEVVDNYEKVMDALNKFKNYGIRVAIDDFGSGYSNFEHILKLRPDYIKIDASLIKNIVTDSDSYVLVEAISQFSKKLGIEVIAEFVSSKEIYDLLQKLDIDEYQGFYFSVPSTELCENV